MGRIWTNGIREEDGGRRKKLKEMTEIKTKAGKTQ